MKQKLLVIGGVLIATFVVCTGILLLVGGESASEYADDQRQFDTPSTTQQPRDSSEEDNTASADTSVCTVPVSELLTRAVNFERVLHSRTEADTAELRQQSLEPFVTDELLQALDHRLPVPFEGSVLATVVDPACSSEMKVAEDATSAYVRLPVQITRLQDGESFEWLMYHESWWELRDDQWVAVSSGGGSS